MPSGTSILYHNRVHVTGRERFLQRQLFKNCEKPANIRRAPAITIHARFLINHNFVLIYFIFLYLQQAW